MITYFCTSHEQMIWVCDEEMPLSCYLNALWLKHHKRVWEDITFISTIHSGIHLHVHITTCTMVNEYSIFHFDPPTCQNRSAAMPESLARFANKWCWSLIFMSQSLFIRVFGILVMLRTSVMGGHTVDSSKCQDFFYNIWTVTCYAVSLWRLFIYEKSCKPFLLQS